MIYHINDPYEDKGKPIRDKIYSDLINEGYKFINNIDNNQVRLYVELMESKGLEIVVHDRAIFDNGIESLKHKGILGRKVKGKRNNPTKSI